MINEVPGSGYEFKVRVTIAKSVVVRYDIADIVTRIEEMIGHGLHVDMGLSEYDYEIDVQPPEGRGKP